MMGQLEGRRVLVTGAASGIGAAAVEVFLAEGAHVTATYRETPPGEPECAGEDGRLRWLRCDFRDESAAEATVLQASEQMGGLDVLLHAAGRWEPGAPGTLTAEDIDRMLDTNVKATVFANQAAFRVMSQSGGGRIINLGSGEGVSGVPHAATYALSKAAVHAWTRSAAKAWGSAGVTVNAMAPAVETPGADRFRDFLGAEGAQALASQLQQSMPVASARGEGLGDPVLDLGPMMVFLASAGSRFVTGQLLSVSGGLLMLGA